MPENELLSVLRAASQQQGIIISRLDAIEVQLRHLSDAERKTSDRLIEWAPHVDRIRGATDATLNRLGQAALITVIVVAALVGGGALLPRLIQGVP